MYPLSKMWLKRYDIYLHHVACTTAILLYSIETNFKAFFVSDCSALARDIRLYCSRYTLSSHSEFDFSFVVQSCPALQL
jgi:hypothetical protein